ncbi:uncharacterized protein Polr1E [Epargyreus clarus]|uniref:uncharacterized protein Polr1E n=1 Tax=Epargyreus clarus TaxID=520877 RepID=UPI003C2F3AC0
MPQLIIDDVIKKADDSPMIMNFQNGYVTDAIKQVPCTVLQDTNTGSKVVVTDIDGMLYTGTEIEEKNVATYIVARNKITGKVRIIESCNIEMKPELECGTDEVDYVQETNNLELSRKFGSKKQKQQMEQREKLKVNVETVTEQMMKVTEQVKEEQVDLAPYLSNDADDFYIPPIDRTAERVEDVYDISKILTDDEFERIHSQLDGKDYTSDMIPWLQSMVTKKSLSSKHTVLAVYANSLLKLYNTVARDISKKTFTACTFSTTLNEIILKNFTSQSNGKLLRPGPYRDKSLCYAMVLILLINGLKFELDGFCQAMKLTANNASMKVRTTGASVITSSGKKVVQLKLPLNNKSGFRRRSNKF